MERAQESPWATGLGLGALAATCRRCLAVLSPKVLAIPICCSGCACTLYCCQSHKTADAEEHSISGECILLQSATARAELGEFIREACLAARLAVKAPAEPPLQDNRDLLLDADQPACGVREAALIRGTAARLVAAAAAAGLALPPGKRRPLLLRDAEQALCCVVTNGLEVIHAEDELSFKISTGVAAAVYKLVARLNHSCRPSAFYHVKPGTSQMVVRTLVPLQPGQEVTIAYVDCLEPGGARRAALRERFCFECRCARCSAAGMPGDAFLGAVSVAADADGSRARELEARLEAAVATAASRYIDQGDASGCRMFLVAALCQLQAAGVHPLHYHCLESYCLLTSACRTADMLEMHFSTLACAAAYAIGSALAAERLVSAGETGVFAIAGRQWLWVARLLCECTAARLKGAQIDWSGKCSSQDDAIRCLAAQQQQVGASPQPPHVSQPTPRSPACQPSINPKNGSCISLESCAEAPAVFRCAWDALMVAKDASVEGEGPVLAQLAGGVGLAAVDGNVTRAAVDAECDDGAAYQHLRRSTHEMSAAIGLGQLAGVELEALTVAAAHAMARAGHLLQLVYGQTHALSEANMFAPFFSHLQAPLTSAIVAAGNATLDCRLSESAEP